MSRYGQSHVVGRTLLLVSCCLLVPAAPLAAQVVAGVDLPVRSRYQWRGLSRHDGWVVQPDAFVAFPLSLGWVTVGAWGSVDFSGPGGGGLAIGRQAFGEVNLWSEISWGSRSMNGALGWTRYSFDGTAAGIVQPPTTNELYARVEVTSFGRIVPRLAAWYDVDQVDGAYLEGSVTVRIPLWSQVVLPVGSLNLTTLAGYSAGQERNPNDPGEAFYFTDRGITHWDFSLWTITGAIPMGWFDMNIGLEFHVQINVDPSTERTAVGRTDDTVTWFGFGVALHGPRCRPSRSICAGITR